MVSITKKEKAKQKKYGFKIDTVADLVKILQKCPQNYKIRNVDEGTFCEICVATDGVEKIVELY